jgi:hypothetical protein
MHAKNLIDYLRQRKLRGHDNPMLTNCKCDKLSHQSRGKFGKLEKIGIVDWIALKMG